MVITVKSASHVFIRTLSWLILASASAMFSVNASQAPVKTHGQLSVQQGKIVDQKNEVVSLAGPSLFWSTKDKEGEPFYHPKTVQTVAHDWNATIIRAAMSAQGEGSYLTHPVRLRQKVESVIEAAIAENIYVIVDWHSHHAEDNIEQAIDFFEKIASKYHQYPNIIYEIYNEPLNNTDWSTVIKPYAEQVIKAIRAIDNNNLIIVGTQTWSQDVDKAAQDPILGFDNIVYSLHFYAGTHKDDLRVKAKKALDAGLALFVSEWGTVNANGDGDIAKESTQQWLSFMKENSLSHCSWSITNKDEGSAMLKPTTTKLGSWQDDELTANGIYLKNIIKNWYKPVH
ncbi:glycoside hydrolase family 5 protein [Colwellia sp. 1_MG-2023]|uniref:glycoside hydrolase family 5 protein n=1 Tax=Colwellia sp. 1_MG-2023 TaxID=3062649 RepID=UPI0026E3206D|nr:glycoside hydrolase family 5 protein [Colwellia sp. 1_MG-2023]MDO6446771.1 glycoside hydrolase family 5 protein [Colwellia sp. 1_MG-2023]